MYNSAQNTMDMERTKTLIFFSKNRMQEVDMQDFALLSSVVEDGLPEGKLQGSVEQP
jgi:hypothetical protein